MKSLNHGYASDNSTSENDEDINKNNYVILRMVLQAKLNLK